MPASSLAISMFHRRVAMLLVLMAGGVVVLTAQLGRLTLVHGSEHRASAESKLVMLDWLPTTRGKILDRQGRVLAKDRPSFDITVDYRVINGEWATNKAAAVAKKLNRQYWGKMSQEERKAAIDQYRGPFEAHIEAMWAKFAETAGLTAAEIGGRRDRITNDVERRFQWLREARYTKGIDRKLKEGLLINEDVEDAILRDASAVIEEQRSPHVVLPKVEDAVGFAFGKLAGQEVEIVIPISSGEMRQTVPLMPGLVVANAGDREYPYEAMSVEMDLASLPGPMKGVGKKKIGVEGVGYHILGRVEANAYSDRKVQRGGKEVTIKGHSQERNDRLLKDPKTGARADEAFAQRVLARGDLHIPEGMRDRGRYEFNDDAGFGGIEESQEDALRGLRGVTVAQLDTGQRTTIDPVVGQDVQLTIDVALQARVQAAMSPEFGLAKAQTWHGHENPTVPVGTGLNGAAVVLDVESGDILALVSTPSMSRRELKSEPGRIFKDEMNLAVNMPWVDRAIGRPYPPGSIVKALVLNGAVKFGKQNLDSPIDCTGHLFPDKPNMFRCWIFKDPRFKSTHTDKLGHALSAPEGLMVSCNIYFFTLGQRLGPDGIRDTFSMFGVGQPWELGVGSEYSGELGVIDKFGKREPISMQDAIQMGIGQGPVSWTPLHAADAYATLARGGKRIRPHVVKQAVTPVMEDLGLDPRAVKEALEGLSLSVNDERGTGNHVDIAYEGREGSDRVFHFKDLPNVKVWGKTGTAEAPKIFTRGARVDPVTKAAIPADPLFDQSVDAAAIREAAHDPSLEFPEGRRALRWGDHSWFVVLVGHQGEDRPLFAIAVMMEYAGSGGKVSGPIINQIIRGLMTEGYL